jgi:hypothetical protein
MCFMKDKFVEDSNRGSFWDEIEWAMRPPKKSDFANAGAIYHCHKVLVLWDEKPGSFTGLDHQRFHKTLHRKIGCW